MEALRRKYFWLGAGVVMFLLSLLIRRYFIQLIFLGTLGIVGYFVYDALELIYNLNARNLADMRANIEIIMKDKQVNKDQLVHEKIQSNTK